MDDDIDDRPIAEQIKWDIIDCIGDGESFFGYGFKGDEWYAIEYDEDGKELARYKLTLQVEGIIPPSESS